MWRLGCVLCLLCVGCGGRAAVALDLGAAERSSSAEVRPPVPDRAADVPATCTSLKLLGQANIEFADTMKLGPRIVFDGEGFGLVWHSQPSIISSMNGELRFARVDATGKASSPDGISLGSDNGVLLAALAASAGKYAVLHMPSSSSVPGVELRQFDASGKTLSVAATTTRRSPRTPSVTPCSSPPRASPSCWSSRTSRASGVMKSSVCVTLMSCR